MSRDVDLYLEDVERSCERILRYAAGRPATEVIADSEKRDAVLWNLVVIGEAVKNVPSETRAQHPAVEWRKIAGFRDIAAHAYFAIDDEILADIISTKVPELLDQIHRVRATRTP